MRGPRIIIIGAGSRGHAYARAIETSTSAVVAAVAEPIAFKRKEFGRQYIWKDKTPQVHQVFTGWREFIQYEENRRKQAAAGAYDTPEGVDAAFICTLDEQHAEIIIALAPLKLHIMCEKPLATTLDDCLSIYAALQPNGPDSPPEKIFGIGHVLRYTPHNILLRKLLLEDQVIGDILSIEHTEPVGWWHFSHSYVRGNWRKESTTAPSLLTKSCHDIDFLLWLLSSPSPASRSPSTPNTNQPPHHPSHLSSTGSLSLFRRARKPPSAGPATNCLSCPIEPECMYSAKKIYLERHLAHGLTDWPVKIVHPEIEDIYCNKGPDAATAALLATLAEDYGPDTPAEEVAARPWFGRCVWESDNDVCDDQIVTLTWDDEPLPPLPSPSPLPAVTTNGHGHGHSADDSGQVNGTIQRSAQQHHPRRFAKTATFHLIAHTLAQCARRGRVYGSTGEIAYDSTAIVVHHFPSSSTQTYYPNPAQSSHYPDQQDLELQGVEHGDHGHGSNEHGGVEPQGGEREGVEHGSNDHRHWGGDAGLVRQFVGAVQAVMQGSMSAEAAQRSYLGAGLEEVVRCVGVVFAAEEARREGRVVEWGKWWGGQMGEIGRGGKGVKGRGL